ncbi:M56 family metallopeptidase [Myroides sp. LJL116]
MIVYWIKSTLLLLVFLVMYYLFLENKPIHTFKRYYLLSSLVIALIGPWFIIPLQINTPLSSEVLQEITYLSLTPLSTRQTASFPLDSIVLWGYVLISAILLCNLAYQIYHLIQLSNKSTIVYLKGQRFAISNQIQSPFSFYSTIYLPLDIELNWNNPIIQHELEHVKQKHTVDIIIINLLKALFWLNPLFYLYQRAITLNHEFLADAPFSKDKQLTQQYLELLLQQSSTNRHSQLCSSFYFRLTKKRINMIFNNKKPFKGKWLITLAFAIAMPLTCLSILAQPSPELVIPTLNQGDQNPSFPGGMQEFRNLLMQNIEYDLKNGPQRIILKFTVEANGEVTNISSINPTNDALASQAIQSLKQMPNWNPKIENGQAVASEFFLPIAFRATE